MRDRFSDAAIKLTAATGFTLLHCFRNRGVKWEELGKNVMYPTAA